MLLSSDILLIRTNRLLSEVIYYISTKSSSLNIFGNLVILDSMQLLQDNFKLVSNAQGKVID